MSGNYVPLVVLGVVVFVVLYLKGYLKVPEGLKAKPSAETAVTSLTGHSALDLSIAFAKAVRQDAENEVALLAATRAAADLKAQFIAPFSAPAPPPAGPEQSPAGPPA